MVGHRVDNCRDKHRQLANCRHAVTAFKPQRNVEKSPPASLHITKPNSDCIPVARSLDICRETRRKVDTLTVKYPTRLLLNAFVNRTAISFFSAPSHKNTSHKNR